MLYSHKTRIQNRMIHTPQTQFLCVVSSEISGDQIPKTKVKLNLGYSKMRVLLSPLLQILLKLNLKCICSCLSLGLLYCRSTKLSFNSAPLCGIQSHLFWESEWCCQMLSLYKILLPSVFFSRNSASSAVFSDQQGVP